MGSSRRLHSGFVVAEIALAVVLLVSAGMLGRTMLRLSSLDPGVNIRNVLTARMALSPDTLAQPGADPRSLAGDPGSRAPRTGSAGRDDGGYRADAGRQQPDRLPDHRRRSSREDRQPLALATSVTPDYLKVMGIPLREGRFFNDRDRMGARAGGGHRRSHGAASVRRAGAGRAAPVDRAGLAIPSGLWAWWAHVRYWGPAGDDRSQVRAQLYYPFAQVPDRFVRRWSELMSIAVRTASSR